MTHTPGPWVYSDGMVWKHRPPEPNRTVEAIPIARMDREPGNGTLPVERDDNARLIAAAPETAAERDRLKTINARLVSVLQKIGELDGFSSDVREDARAAIAKAQSDQWEDQRMFTTSVKMHRAVTRDCKRVEFCNAVGGFIGTTYKFKCSTVAKAKAFEKFCRQRDPVNDDMPIAVGIEVAAQFGAQPA